MYIKDFEKKWKKTLAQQGMDPRTSGLRSRKYPTVPRRLLFVELLKQIYKSSPAQVPLSLGLHSNKWKTKTESYMYACNASS